MSYADLCHALATVESDEEREDVIRGAYRSGLADHEVDLAIEGDDQRRKLNTRGDA